MTGEEAKQILVAIAMSDHQRQPDGMIVLFKNVVEIINTHSDNLEFEWDETRLTWKPTNA